MQYRYLWSVVWLIVLYCNAPHDVVSSVRSILVEPSRNTHHVMLCFNDIVLWTSYREVVATSVKRYFFSNYRCCPATLFKFNILASPVTTVYEFDTAAAYLCSHSCLSAAVGPLPGEDHHRVHLPHCSGQRGPVPPQRVPAGLRQLGQVPALLWRHLLFVCIDSAGWL